MKKLYLYLILVVAIGGTAGYFWLSNPGAREAKYRTEKASRGDITVQVRATGTINPVQTVQVGSQVSGTISKIHVDFNSSVKKDQVIAEIDPTFLAASVKEADANLERNQAQVNEAKRTLDRTTELFKKNLVAQADLDAATTGYESSNAQLKQTQAALDRAKVNLRFAIIRAPIDGVVISRDIDVGQTVAASLQTPKLFEIANDLTQMQVQASVDEADIGQIKIDEGVTFSVDAYPEDQFQGRVSQIRLAPVTVQNVVTYTVIIDVPNADLKLRPGMTATVSILVDKRENALRVPTLALRLQPTQEMLDQSQQAKAGDSTAAPPDTARQGWRGRQRDGMAGRRDQQGGGGRRDRGPGKMARIWVLGEDKSVRQVTVMTGISDNRYIEVVRGKLNEGDELIIGINGIETASASNPQSNPFQQRMPGGGGGGGGRGRGF